MIIYVCNCGSKLVVEENTEKSRRNKVRWKRKHSKGSHRWVRRTVREKQSRGEK